MVGDRVLFTIQSGVGSITPRERAEIVNRRIRSILSSPEMRPEEITTQAVSDRETLILLPAFPILSVSSGDLAGTGMRHGELADLWARLLRQALVEVKPLYRAERKESVRYLPLLLVSILAVVVPILTSRFRRIPVPVVVGEILVGIAIGQSGLNIIPPTSWLEFLADFGLAFLMFLSGLEVDLDMISAPRSSGLQGLRSQSPWKVALTVFALTVMGAAMVGAMLASVGLVRNPLVMTLILSTTSLGLVLPVLKERDLLIRPYGQTLLLTAVLADFITMFLLTVVTGWLSSGPTLKLFVGLVLIGMFAAALRVGEVLARFTWLRNAFDDLSHASVQFQVRTSLALMLAFVATSQQLGTEAILGAFLAGLLLSLHAGRQGHELYTKLEALGFGFFIPIFFIMVGARFDLGSLLESRRALMLAPALLMSAIAIKVLAALPFRWVASWRETLAAGLLTSSRLSLAIAASEVAARLDLISEAARAAIILVAVVTSMVGPMGFQVLMPRERRRGRRIIIVGKGGYASLLAGRLERQGWEVDLHESEVPPDMGIGEGGSASLHAVVSGPGTPGASHADVLVAATSSDEMNENACTRGASLGIPRRVALVHDAARAQKIRDSGGLTVMPMLSTLWVLEGMVSHPAVFRLLSEGDADTCITELALGNAAFVGRPLRDVHLPSHVRILSIQRAGNVIVPFGSTRLEQGDILVIIGTHEQIREGGAILAGQGAN